MGKHGKPDLHVSAPQIPQSHPSRPLDLLGLNMHYDGSNLGAKFEHVQSNNMCACNMFEMCCGI